MDCKHLCEHLHLYIDGELDADDRMEFEEHLRFCYDCREQVEAERAILEAIRIELREGIPQPSEQFSERLDDIVNTQLRPRRTREPFLRIAFGMIGVLLVAFVVSFSLINLDPVGRMGPIKATTKKVEHVADKEIPAQSLLQDVEKTYRLFGYLNYATEIAGEVDGLNDILPQITPAANYFLTSY